MLLRSSYTWWRDVEKHICDDGCYCGNHYYSYYGDHFDYENYNSGFDFNYFCYGYYSVCNSAIVLIVVFDLIGIVLIVVLSFILNPSSMVSSSFLVMILLMIFPSLVIAAPLGDF
jgi:hypothetical protein